MSAQCPHFAKVTDRDHDNHHPKQAARAAATPAAEKPPADQSPAPPITGPMQCAASPAKIAWTNLQDHIGQGRGWPPPRGWVFVVSYPNAIGTGRAGLYEKKGLIHTGRAGIRQAGQC